MKLHHEHRDRSGPTPQHLECHPNRVRRTARAPRHPLRICRGWGRLVSLLAILLLGACLPSNSANRPGTIALISADGAQLSADGAPFEMRGVNYIHPSNADLVYCSALQFGADAHCPWDPTAIDTDMDRLRALGVNTVRVFLNYYVFGGAQAADPNYRMDQPLAHLDTFIDAANRRGIYVMPVLLAKYPQDRFDSASADLAIALHVRPVVLHLAGRPGIIAWDLFNEPDLGGPVNPHCWDWDNGAFPLCFPLANERLHFVNRLHDEVKRLDTQRLTTVSLGFAKNYFRPEGADLRLADVVDILSFHYYDNDPYESGRYAEHWYYGQGFPDDLHRAIDELHALNVNKPIAITELGFPTGAGAKRNLTDLARDFGTALDIARNKKTSGILLWPFQSPPEQLVGTLFQP